MYHITRRQLITKTLLALSSSIASTSIYSNQPLIIKYPRNYSKFQHECYIVYQEWIKKEPLSPKNFLIELINNSELKYLKITDLTIKDFHDKKFLSINGLLLGKTEAALLALLGSDAKF